MKWARTAKTHEGAPCARCGATLRLANGQCYRCKREKDLAAQAQLLATMEDAHNLRPRPIPPWRPPRMAPGLTLARLMAGK